MLTVEEAAARLGVSGHEVRRLIRVGTLPAQRVGRTITLDDAVVEARARLPIAHGRALAPATAWATLWELSGEPAGWLDRSGRSRLHARLRTWDADRLVAAVRERADRFDLRVLPAYRDRALATDGVVTSGMSAAAAVGADIVAVGAAAEIYCSAATLARLRREYGLSDRGEVNLHIRVPRFDDLPLTGRVHMPVGVVAADLAESADVRTRRAGRDLLIAALAARGR